MTKAEVLDEHLINLIGCLYDKVVILKKKYGRVFVYDDGFCVSINSNAEMVFTPENNRWEVDLQAGDGRCNPENVFFVDDKDCCKKLDSIMSELGGRYRRNRIDYFVREALKYLKEVVDV